jgi:uncharacterized protein
MSMPFFERSRAWFVNLRYLVPAFLVFLAAAFVRHPAAVLLLLSGDALAMAGVCRAAGFRHGDSLSRSVLRRGFPFLLLLLLYAGLVVLLVAYPLQWLIRDRSLGATLAVSTEAVVAVLSLWRHWPAFGLIFVWRDADSGRRAGASIGRCVGFAQQITGRNELFFSHGLGVALSVMLLVVGAAAVGTDYAFDSRTMQLAASAVYALLLAPLALVLIVNRCAHALLIDLRRQRNERASAAASPSIDPDVAIVEQPAAPVAMAEDWDARLLRCARAGQTDLALAALLRGADPNAVPPASDRDQRSVVVLATLATDMRLLRGLIAKGADINRVHAGLTPLIAATRDSHQGRPEAVMTLLTNGADPRCVDPAGNTPLHYAALSATPIVSALLCDAAAPLDAVNRDGQSPLAMACAAGNWALVRFLLERGARTDVERGQPAILGAASVADDDPTGVQLLHKRKCRIDAHDALGRTALMIAALQGNAAVAEALIDAGARVDAADGRGTTALMEAARAGSQPVLELVAARDAAVDAVDAMGRTALIIAAQSRQAGEATIRVLLAAGASRDVRTADGKRAVDFAAAAGRWKIVALLDPDYPVPANVADAAAGQDESAPSLHLLDALRFGHWQVVETFEQEIRSWEPAELQRLYLQLLAPESSAPRAWIVDHGLQRIAPGDAGTRLLETLLARLPEAAAAAVEWLEAGASPAGTNAPTAICLALARAEGGRAALERLAAATIERGAEVFAGDAEGRTALAHAVAAGSTALVRALLDRGVDANVRDRHGRTPLFDALALPAERAEALVRMLIAAGANPEVAAVNGETPLGLALARPDTELRRWLNWPQWKLPRRRLRGADLPAAAAAGDVAAIDKLLDLGVPIGAVDAQGATALLRAAGCGHAAVVRRLLDRGADPAQAAPSGATALSAAVTARREATVSALLEHGVPVDSCLPTGGTPLMIAAALGFSEIVARLLAHGAAVNASDERGTRALHAAAQFAFRSSETDSSRRSIQLLLEHGAEVDATNAAGQTALLLLLGGSADPGSGSDQKHLLELLPLFLFAHADLDIQDERGVGPLHACAMHGLLLVARALLAAKADPMRRDVLERTPRQVAHMLGYIDLAAEFGAREPVAHVLGDGR